MSTPCMGSCVCLCVPCVCANACMPCLAPSLCATGAAVSASHHGEVQRGVPAHHGGQQRVQGGDREVVDPHDREVASTVAHAVHLAEQTNSDYQGRGWGRGNMTAQSSCVLTEVAGGGFGRACCERAGSIHALSRLSGRAPHSARPPSPSHRSWNPCARGACAYAWLRQQTCR